MNYQWRRIRSIHNYDGLLSFWGIKIYRLRWVNGLGIVQLLVVQGLSKLRLSILRLAIEGLLWAGVGEGSRSVVGHGYICDRSDDGGSIEVGVSHGLSLLLEHDQVLLSSAAAVNNDDQEDEADHAANNCGYHDIGVWCLGGDVVVLVALVVVRAAHVVVVFRAVAVVVAAVVDAVVGVAAAHGLNFQMIGFKCIQCSFDDVYQYQAKRLLR